MSSFVAVSVLEEVVESLAGFERRAGSPGETAAAHWIAARLMRSGARNVRIDRVAFYDGYALMLLPLAVAGVASGLSVGFGRPSRRRRVLAAAASGLAAAVIADDVSNGRRFWRRTVQRPKETTNVVAEVGDADARKTLVVLAHHDAAPTGAIFDQRLHHWVAARAPWLIARINTSLPLWWPIAGAPALVSLGAALGHQRLTRLGTALGVGVLAAGSDIARNRIVPGANDNLSAVAALVGLAEQLTAEPIRGVRVVLASIGAEEVLQGGIYPFRDQHLAHLDRDQTWVINLDTIGSPELVLVEGEGQFWMEDYCDPSFRDLIAEVAETAIGGLSRGARSRGSTDAVVTSRAGYPTALLSSWDSHRALSNYHLMTDTPQNLNYTSVMRAAALCRAVVRQLAASSKPLHPHPATPAV